MAVAEWLAHWLHMQEVRGSNPGLGMHFFSSKIIKNLTKIGYRQCKQRKCDVISLQTFRKSTLKE